MSEYQRGRGARGHGGPRGGADNRGAWGGRGGGGGFQDRGGRGGGGGGFQDRGGRGGGGGGGGFQDRGGRGGGAGFHDRGGRGGGFQDRGGRGGRGFQHQGGRGDGGGVQRRGGRGRGAGDQGVHSDYPSAWASYESKEREVTPQLLEASGSASGELIEGGGDSTFGGSASVLEPQPGPSTCEEAPGESSSAHQKKRKGKKGVIEPQTEGAKVIESQMKQLSLRHEDRMLPRRPDIGTVGQVVKVGVNCWDFDISDVLVYMYDLEPTRAFREKNHDLKAKPKMLRELLRDVVNGFPEDTFYDGGRILYSLKKLDGVGAESVKRLVPVADPLERDDLWLEYTIQEVKRISASSIFEYLNNPYARTSEIPQDAINMVDNLLKWVNRKTFVNFGRSAMFFPDPKQRVDQKLFVIHSGFMFSVRPQWKVRMNIDMVHKAFFPTGNLADILYAKYEESIYDQRNWPMMLADINGIRVEADHYKTEKGKSYKKRFTVFGLSPDSAEREMIPELKISIMAYFDKQYSIKLKYPELPCIKTKKDKNEYIPMELLTVLPYQNPNADKGDIASAVIRCAAVRPGDRFKELDSFVNQFMRNQHCLLKQFKLKLPNSKPVTVDARELPQPTGQFQGAPMSLGRGKWNPLKFYRPASGQVTWAVFATPVSRFSQQGISTVLRELPRAANNCGLDVSAQPFLAQPVPPAHLEQKFDECQRNGVKLMVFVLSGSNEYSQIKRLGDLHKGMVTQCVKSQTLTKPNVFPNLLLKINGKLGGTNWLVNSLKIDDKLMMVMGADVTHPAPTGGNRELSKSVAAVIASISPDLMQYAAVVRQQDRVRIKDKATREVIDAMELIVTDLLNVFGKHNNRLPDKIIFYRDGVSEGQFETVLREELTAIQKACASLQQGYEPGVTFIVVQKRHHIRFNPTDPRARNVNPGTVVDTHITHKREFDFYLCSQEGIQGTSKPAHYHVLYDDNNWSSNALQSFTYYLCHAYMRCCRSVSYPAPTFYSHLAAFRARDWLKGSRPQDHLLDQNRFRVNAVQQSRMFFL